MQTDDEIDDFVSANMESTMHPCGTCRTGEDALSVVDSELRVHGLRGLRVIDSSIFPTEPNGNLNAPTIMVAERGSDLILGKDLLPQIDLPVGLAEHWQTRQRPGTAQRAYAP